MECAVINVVCDSGMRYVTEISTDNGFPDYESYFSFENSTAFLSDLPHRNMQFSDKNNLLLISSRSLSIV